jgi:hypothetical protein
MDNIELDNLNQPEGAEGGEVGEDETNIDDTPADEDDFQAGIDRLDRQDDDVRTSSFYEENKNDKYTKRKRELMDLYSLGKFDTIKGEYIKRCFESEYRIYPDDGPVSERFLSRVDLTENRLTFDGTPVVNINTSVKYVMHRNKKSAGPLRTFMEEYEISRVLPPSRPQAVMFFF